MPNCCSCVLITISDFYSITNITESVVGDDLKVAINETQEKYILPLICEDLFAELCEQIANASLTELNSELLCLLKDIHVRYAFADFIFLHPIRITKEAVVRKVSNESEFVSSEENAKISQYWRMQASTYVSKLKKFLKDNNLDTCNQCDEGHGQIEDDFCIF